MKKEVKIMMIDTNSMVPIYHLQTASMSTLDTLAEKLMDENDETFRELAK